MNEVKLSGGTLTLTDPETGEKYELQAETLRAMVGDIAKECPEIGAPPVELFDKAEANIDQDVLDALVLKDAGHAVKRMEGENRVEIGALKATPKATATAVTLNRKQRRANDKVRRSAKYQQAEAKRRAAAMKAMQAHHDEQERLKAEAALIDVPFADPRHIGKITRVFAPIDAAINGYESGEVATIEDGTAVMWVNEEGTWFPAVATLRAIIETYAKLGHTHGWRNHNAGLTHLANLIERGEQIHQKDIDAARKTIEWMKYCTLTITPRQFTAEAVEVQVASEMRDAGIAPQLTDADLLRDAV